MKRFIVLLFALSSVVCYAQNPKITVDGGIKEQTTDLDAKAYFPKYDVNDRLCALLKVTVSNELKNPLILEVGGLGVVAREEKESGEIWFYLPAQVKNLNFKCKGYEPMDPISAQLKEGVVYRLKLTPDAVIKTVTTAVITTNYLKMEISEPNAIISIGKTLDYEYTTQTVDGVEFDELLEYGMYYYKVEHPLYKAYHGSVELNNSTPKQKITLTPAYGYLDINTTPSGATVYIDNQKVGTTPFVASERMPQGSVMLRVELDEYYTHTSRVEVLGNGSHQNVSLKLKPRFANITLSCPDEEAEIWIDGKFKGNGTWSGRLGSMTPHHVETRHTSHEPQAINITVQDGVDATHTIPAPIPLYGALNITTQPKGCSILIDGKVVGESPYMGQILIGKHQVELLHENYRSSLFDVEIETNKICNVDRELEMLPQKATVSLVCIDKDAELYVNGTFVGIGLWRGELEKGKYRFEARRNAYTPGVREEIIVDTEANLSFLVPEPQEPSGTLSVKCKSGSTINLRSLSNNQTRQYPVKQMTSHQLAVGDYQVYATKEGYTNSPTKKIMIREGKHTSVRLPMKRSSWGDAIDWCFNDTNRGGELYAEVTISTEEEVGVTLGMFPWWREGHLGFHTSITENNMLIGPLIRFDGDKTLRTQLYAGVGYDYTYGQMAYEGGVRFCCNLYDIDFLNSSAIIGVKKIGETWGVTFGMSIDIIGLVLMCGAGTLY